jgi:hypothetical protein
MIASTTIRTSVRWLLNRSRPANIPPLSSGRIRKSRELSGGDERARGNTATGDRQDGAGHGGGRLLNSLLASVLELSHPSQIQLYWADERGTVKQPQTCDDCRHAWNVYFAGSALATNAERHSALYRCRACGTPYEVFPEERVSPRAIGEDEARQVFPAMNRQVCTWIAQSTNHVEVLPVDEQARAPALVKSGSQS